jgi:putative ABC transport system substrate-binding protein
MKRRAFITLLASAAVVWPLDLRAQAPGRIYRLGGLTPSPRDAPHYTALFDELRRLGFTEGQNLTVDWRGYELQPEQFPDVAVELVKAKPDVIFCAGDAACRAAQQGTATIPILAVTDDLVGSGLSRSLARPDSNTTGVSILATELDGKRQEILIEAVPGLRRMAALADANTSTRKHVQALQDGARARGVELLIHWVARSEEVAPAIDAARTSNAAALNVLSSPLLVANRRVIIERAAALRLPAVYQWAEMAEEGGLVAYGPRLFQMFRELGSQHLIRLFRGATPIDLPVVQPTRFELCINLRTAKAIGHEVPVGLVLRADKVIE